MKKKFNIQQNSMRQSDIKQQKRPDRQNISISNYPTQYPFKTHEIISRVEDTTGTKTRIIK